MTRKKAGKEPEKAQRLSLAELAAHDDVCSDVMVDNTYYKSKIRKNRGKHNPIRGIKDEEIPKILLNKVIVDKDVRAAEKALLALPGLKRYKKSLRTKTEQEHFVDHLRKYIAMYQTDCAWEVSTTNRYTITTYEAAVTARRRIRQGDTIRYLTGTLVPLTTEESADLDNTHRNFSIVVSGRKKNSSIFLGPARFANHDCDANGRLVPRGENGMEVVAMKNIEVGDELTVSYGDDYFGPGNMDCLCHTCELLERNGWTSKAGILDSPSRPSTPVHESLLAIQPRGLKRKRESDGFHSSSAPPPSKHAKTTQSPSKLQQSWTPPDTSDSETAQQKPVERKSEPIETLRQASPQRTAALSPPPSQPPTDESESPDPIQLDAKLSTPVESSGQSDDVRQQSPASDSQKADSSGKTTARLLEKLSANAPMSPAPTSPSSNGVPSEVGAMTEPTAQAPISDAHVIIKVESVETTKMEVDEDTIIVAPSKQRDSTLNDVHNKHPGSQLPPARAQASDSKSNVPHTMSTLATTKITKEIRGPASGGTISTENGVVPSIEPAISSTTVSTLTVHPMSGIIRIAGDYILTRKLLAQPHDRWVQCHNQICHDFFIQPNGYQTRRECPRCERHSMLYGFPWPKTDPDPRKLLERKSQGSGRGKKNGTPAVEYSAYRRQGKSGKGTWVEGGGDSEERVMDHRTIHRFVNPEDEREITRKGLLKQAEDARAAGDHTLAILEAKMHARALFQNNSTESAARDASESGSATPDELRRRSNRFVTKPVGVYTDKF